jgi:hypothetical protein
LKNGTSDFDAGTLDSGGPGADGGGADTSQPPPADSGPINGDENPPASACTAPPFVNFATTVSEFGGTYTIGPAAGATVQFSSCAGFEITAGSDGKALTKITKGIALSPIYAAAPAAVSEIGAEIPATSDVDITALLIQQSAIDRIPQYDGTAPTILLQIVAEGTAPCDAVSGVTIAATGHPEMVAHYMNATWPTDKTVGSNTQSVGPYAFFSGVVFDGGSKIVSLTGTKTGCQVKLVTASQTGRFALVPSSITFGRATVTN